jgi:ADP-heptose:LPS heptosyltransferase
MATPKTWGPDNFIALMHRLKERWPEMSMVVVGDKADSLSTVQRLQQEVPFLVNTAGQTTLDELAEILQKAALVICHDSGVMHLANASGADLIALYGPTDDTRTRPLGPKSRLLFSRNECFRAMYNWNLSEQELAKKYPDHYCLSGITVDQVYELAVEVVGLPGPPLSH